MIRKSPYKRGEWPSNDAGVTRKTPSATALFGGGRQHSYQCEGTKRGEQLKNKSWGTRDFWTERTP